MFQKFDSAIFILNFVQVEEILRKQLKKEAFVRGKEQQKLNRFMFSAKALANFRSDTSKHQKV